MPIHKYHGSGTHHIAYVGKTQYKCPHCEVVAETETIEVPMITSQEQFEAGLYNIPVLRLALVEGSTQVEIDYVCHKCHLPIKLVRPLED